MANRLNLFLVADDKTLVKSQTDQGGFALPPMVQGDIALMSLTLLEKNPTGGIQTPFTRTTEQQVVRVGIVTPNSTASVVHALGTLAYVSPAGTYSGSLSLATAEIASLLGSAQQVQSTFEIEIQGAGNTVQTTQKPVQISADGLKVGAPVSIGGTQSFYDASTTDSLFLKRAGSTSAQANWDVSILHGAAATQAKFTRDTDSKVFSFGSWTGAAWSNNADTLTTRSDVILVTGGTATGEIHFASNPSHANALARKSYVDATALAGGTITGTLVLGRDPVLNMEAATRQFVLANSGQPPINSTLAYTGSILGVSVLTTGSLVGYTHRHTTAQIDEESGPQFFTEARVLATDLAGIDTSTTGVVTSSDTVLSGAGKLEASKVSASAGTFTGAVRFPYASAVTPSMTNSLGASTGIYFPASDPNATAFASASSEVARFHGNGLTVGSTAQIARLGVVGTSNEVQFAVRAHSTQTADILRTEDSTGNVKARINQHHALSISNDGLVASETKGVRITATSTTGAAAIELLNNEGGSVSGLKLTGTGGSPSRGLVLENLTPGDVYVKTDGITRIQVTNNGEVLFSHITLSGSGLSVNGNLYYSSTIKALRVYANGLDTGIPGVLFTSYSDKVVTNTTSETSVVPTDLIGGLTLPANFWTVGKIVRVSLFGKLRTKASSPGLLTIKVKLGSTIIASTGGFSLDSALSDSMTRMDFLMNCRSTGASGNIKVIGPFEFFDPGSLNMKLWPLTQGGGSTADTTASALLDLTATFSVNDVSNTWTTDDVVVESLN